ncbi:MAG: hypothetical protein H8E79_06095 [Desulfobulbaceae bacterium]|uniref:Tetratricopeptide repeat protein n=1 Tax=Candidatus Desulfatifera sulfidica TaxID=2841691 RepID=A0A8J6TCM7_9BACT|nr:hypothetical protein [Candidatus Desulfatifera sulfidica]
MNVKRLLITCLAVDCLLLSACVPGKQQLVLSDSAVAPPRSVVVQPTLDEAGKTSADQKFKAMALGFANSRIEEYLLKQERWKELDGQRGLTRLDSEQSAEMIECFHEMHKIIGGYSQLRGGEMEGVLQAGPGFGSETIFVLQQADIDFVEGRCGALLTDEWGGGAIGAPEGAGEIQQAENLMAERFAADDFTGVISAWQQVQESMRSQLSVSSRLQYVQALIDLRYHQVAIPVLDQLLSEFGIPDHPELDALALGTALGDLYLVTGDYKLAEKQYGNLLQLVDQANLKKDWANRQLALLAVGQRGGLELREYGALLADYLSFNPTRDGYKLVWAANAFLKKYPYSPVKGNVERIRIDAQNHADQWLSGYMQEVETLTQEKRFQDSSEKLATVTPEIIDETTRLQIQQKLEALKEAEKLEQEQQVLARQQVLQEQWDESVRILESGAYDEAIQMFTQLLETDLGEQARSKIKDVALSAAKDDRRKAADLFIRSTRAADLETRKQLLLESRRYLLGILEKYPDVDIVDKVMGNIQRVEKDLHAIDPVLLRSPEAATQSGIIE